MFFFLKQKTAYEMRISDWSSDVCSSDLTDPDSSEARRRGLFHWSKPMALIDEKDRKPGASRSVPGIVSPGVQGAPAAAAPGSVAAIAAKSFSDGSDGKTERKSTRLNSSP